MTRYFRKTQHSNTEELGKLDDRLQPIPADIHGAVVRTDAERLKKYENEGKKLLSFPKSFTLNLKVSRSCSGSLNGVS